MVGHAVHRWSQARGAQIGVSTRRGRDGVAVTDFAANV